MRPYYPVSGLFRITRDADGLQLDFMDVIDGIPSFEGLRRRSKAVRFGETTIQVARLADIIRSKKAARRPQDVAVLPVLEKTLAEEAHHQTGETESSQEGE